MLQFLAWEIPWTEDPVYGVTKSRTQLSIHTCPSAGRHLPQELGSGVFNLLVDLHPSKQLVMNFRAYFSHSRQPLIPGTQKLSSVSQTGVFFILIKRAHERRSLAHNKHPRNTIHY